MGRIYTVHNPAGGFTTEISLFVLETSTEFVRLHEFGVSQRLSDDVGDTEEELILIKFSSGYTNSGTAGGITTVSRMPGDATNTAGFRSSGTTKAFGGTPVQHQAWQWNIRVPFQYRWPPHSRPYFKPSSRAMIEFATTPNDQILYSAYIVFEEIG